MSAMLATVVEQHAPDQLCFWCMRWAGHAKCDHRPTWRALRAAGRADMPRRTAAFMPPSLPRPPSGETGASCAGLFFSPVSLIHHSAMHAAPKGRQLADPYHPGMVLVLRLAAWQRCCTVQHLVSRQLPGSRRAIATCSYVVGCWYRSRVRGS